jgi:hypothetical protein
VVAVLALPKLFEALPVTSPYIRVGSPANCGGYAGTRISLAPADTYELVNVAQPPEGGWDAPEWIDDAVAETGEGVAAELVELFGELPAVRVTVLELLGDPYGTSPINRLAGRNVLRQSLHDAGLPVTAPQPRQGYRVLRP